MKGTFITVEGPDGAGKSTQIKLLTEYLEDKGCSVILTREPGGTNISEIIRNIILDNDNTEMASITEALLYAASRAQHVHEIIIPALNNGKIIICDRFVHSSLVYQGVGRNLGIDKVKHINDFAIQGVKPDITLFLDISPEVALKRKTKSNKGDRLEQEDVSFHRKVYEGYLEIIKMFPNEIDVVDASGSINSIFNRIKLIVDKKLSIKRC